MKKILIKNGIIVTMDKQRRIFQGDLLIEGSKIIDMGEEVRAEADKVIEAAGRVVIPGLIQTHIHLTQTLFRNQADDLELLDWLKERVWPLEGAHTMESNYISAKLGIAELIKGGTTAIIDMETVHHTDAAFEALYESGFRAISGKCMMDYGRGVPATLMEKMGESIDNSIKLLKKWHQKGNGRLQYAFAPRFVVSCSEELLIKVRDLAKEYDVMIQTHASENLGEIKVVERDRGKKNIKYLHHIGLTGEKLVLAHCIWLDEEEMRLLTETGTKVVHCPNSNLKLASGIAKIPELISMGVNVSLGADGAPCNNNLDIFQEMKSAALIHKARLLKPTTMPSSTVFEMATLGGAKAMGMEDKIGSLEVGKLADIAIINLSRLHTAPNNVGNIISQLVYSATAADVETTIIDGTIVMENRELKTINEKTTIEDSNRIIKQQIERSGIVLARRIKQ